MEAARFERVALHRADLRTRFPRRFRARLEGCRVTGLTRRAKYLLAHLSSGETLLMHLGMSGSFRVEYGGNGSEPPADAGRHDHVVFTMSSHATVFFNDPRRFGFMDLVPAGRLDTHPTLSRLGPEPLSAGFDGAVLAAACRGKKVSLKSRADGSAGGRRPRQHLCERGAPRRAALAAQEGVDDQPPPRERPVTRRTVSPRRSSRCSKRPSNGRPARSTGPPGSVSTTARASAAGSAAARVRSEGRPRPAARRSTAPAVSASRTSGVGAGSDPRVPERGLTRPERGPTPPGAVTTISHARASVLPLQAMGRRR